MCSNIHTKFLFVFTICIWTLTCKTALCKPSSSDSVPSLRQAYQALPLSSHRNIVSSSFIEDGKWQASARLPSSSETGGSMHSRYRISRDSSLSLSLQPSNSSNNNNNEAKNFFDTDPKLIFNKDHDRDSKVPTELRSFSVVLSDVEVEGNYENQQIKDAYAKSGVKSYNIHSNSIHRMNASWKLNNGGGYSSPTSTELLKFLSIFTDTNQDGGQHDKIQHPPGVISLANHSKNTPYKKGADLDLPPFTTWSESSRNIPENDTFSLLPNNDNNTEVKVTHELITVLKKLNDTYNDADRVPKELKLNSSLSETLFQEEEETTEKLFKMTDPQQSANDLKKLISLLIKSDLNKNGNSSGTDVINILVNPSNQSKQKIMFLKSPQIQSLIQSAVATSANNNNNNLASSNSILKILSSAMMNQPNSTSTQSSDSISNMNYNRNPYQVYHSVEGDSATPDGFPLPGSEFLNLHHPNLQFHQALHHLLANGSTPTSITATTKTNIINIFVINFNGSSSEKQSYAEQGNVHQKIKPTLLENIHKAPHLMMLNKLMASPSSVISQSFDTRVTLPPPFRPTSTLSSIMFVGNNNNNRPMKTYKSTVVPVESQEHKLWPYASSSTPTPPVAINDKVSILDLLPGTVNSATKVENDSEVTVSVAPLKEFFANFLPDKSRDPEETLNLPTPSPGFWLLNRKPVGNHAEILEYLKSTPASPNRSTYTTPISTISTTTEPPLPPELAHLSWIFQTYNNKAQLNQLHSTLLPQLASSSAKKPQKALVNKKVFISDAGYSGSIEESQGYDDTDLIGSFIDEKTADSMMEAEESINPFLQHLHNFSQHHAPIPNFLFELNSIASDHLTVENSTNRLILGQDYSTTTNSSNSSALNETLVEVTTSKPPAFSKYGTKIPDGGFPEEPSENNNRLRKIMAAIGYSTIPTVAAGAIATWPFWAPLLGKKRRRRDADVRVRNAKISNIFSNYSSNEPQQQQLGMDNNATLASNPTISINVVNTLRDAETMQNSTDSLLPQERQMELKSTANSSEAEKWIKVKVITDRVASSPTLGASVKNSTNNRLLMGNGEPQDDVPLLKNFLKNVLANEWAQDSSQPLIVPHSHHHNHYSNLGSKPNSDNGGSGSLSSSSKDKLMRQPPTPFIAPGEFTTFTPPGQNVSLLITSNTKIPWGGNKPSKIDEKIKEYQNLKEIMRRKKIKESIQLSKTSYTAAALLPLWFPVMFGIQRDHPTDLTTQNGRSTDKIAPKDRSNRRLHKWAKEELLSDETANNEGDSDNTNTAQSNLNDESLENSSERDVFIEDNGAEEGSSSDEEANPTNGPKTASLTTWHDGEGEAVDAEEDDEKMIEKQKSDGSPTTPKGLTTWSAVNGGSSGSYVKGSVQKIPSEYTVSGSLSFNAAADKSTTSVDLVTKERSTFPTTEMPGTTKSSVTVTTMANKRKPYHKNKKVVLPSKFVKPPLEDITAEAIGTDATHTIYKTKVADPVQSKIEAMGYTTKKPQWPYQMPVKRIVTKRPVAFSRITSKPKTPYVKKPQMPSLTITTPTTTTPSSTTVYNRQPAPLIYPFPGISFTNLGFMDFLRSQIIPRIGLSLISFMAASPLILSMIGANALGRRKRSLDRIDGAHFELVKETQRIPFDFSTIKRKLHKMQMQQDKKPKKSVIGHVAEIITKLINTKAFAMLKSKFLESPPYYDSKLSTTQKRRQKPEDEK